MTSQEPQTSHDADEYAPATEVIAVPEPAPVFVDSTGRRSRLLRRLALAFGILLVAYGGLVSVSLAGGPVSSSAVFPLPGLDDAEDAPKAEPGPTPAPTPTPSAARRIVESAQRDGTDQRRPPLPPSAKASAKPSKSPTPKPSRSKATASPTATKPVESATVTKEPDPGPGSGTPVPPLPPPAVEARDSGGAGGGGPVTGSPIPAGKPPVTAGDTTAPSLAPVADDPADSAAPSTRAAP